MKWIVILLCVLLLAEFVFSSPLVWDFAYIDYRNFRPNQDPFMRAHCEKDGSYAGCDMLITINITPGTPGVSDAVALIVAYDEPNAGDAMNWRVMDIGDEVGYETMVGKDKDYFYSNWINDDTGAPSNDYNIQIKTGEHVYLGGVSNETYREIDNNYFWLELIFDGTTVQVGQSAIEMERNTSIFIQPRGVPEPGAAVLALLGVCACALRRKVT